HFNNLSSLSESDNDWLAYYESINKFMGMTEVLQRFIISFCSKLYIKEHKANFSPYPSARGVSIYNLTDGHNQVVFPELIEKLQNQESRLESMYGKASYLNDGCNLDNLQNSLQEIQNYETTSV
ncbi:MAG TPA: hypothetical protein V6C96_03805, partial [Vampirovibrionales bacterium]